MRPFLNQPAAAATHLVRVTGKPTIREKHIAMQTVSEFSAAGESREGILRQYPGLEPEDIDACLEFVAELMAHEYTLHRVVYGGACR